MREIKKKLDFIPPIVTLLSAGIALIFSMIEQYNLLDSLLCILITIMFFFPFGLCAEGIILRIVIRVEEKEAEEAERLEMERQIREAEEAERLEQERLEQERLEKEKSKK